MSILGEYSGFGFVSGIIPVFVIIIFLVVIGTFIVRAIKGARRYAKNNASPVLSVKAKIVGRREDVTRHMHNADNHMHHHISTSYYATFEVESGERLEFAVNGDAYGMLIEGDHGQLTFQGTRYLGFERAHQQT